MTRVGEVLRDFTIGERPFGIQEVDATSRHGSHPRERRRVKSPNAATDAEASEAQAPYLIWMLSRTMRLSISMNFVNEPITSSDRRSKTVQQDISCSALYADAHIRLQHTLVRAVFGERLAADFEPGLEPPPIPSGGDLRTDLDTQIETADVGDWFKDEVWRLVGWDVLRGNMTWD